MSQNDYKPRGFGGFSFFPPVIKNLLIINGIVFFITIIADNIMLGDSTLGNIITEYFAIIPFSNPYASFYPWQLITYQFMHGGFWHIGMNMFILWMFGMEIENIMGSRKFLVFYLLAGIGGGLLQLFLGSGSGPIIGASGAVYGVMVAFALFFPNRLIYVYALIPVKAKYLIVFVMVMEFMSVGNGDFTAHLAHLGGAIVGFVFITYDKTHNFNFDRLFDLFKSDSSQTSNPTFTKKKSGFSFGKKDVQEAEFYDINSKTSSNQNVNQKSIDEILDKISESGYKNLTEAEKKILFDASKKN
ncbi:MAG: rhomboid family intramembrane serine protease [Ignavibacteriae bacterium]|nr:rhomboid family intramembrane serine protease [Ignavibacteriota bacterium]